MNAKICNYNIKKRQINDKINGKKQMKNNVHVHVHLLCEDKTHTKKKEKVK